MVVRSNLLRLPYRSLYHLALLYLPIFIRCIINLCFGCNWFTIEASTTKGNQMPNHTQNYLTICFKDRISRDTFRQLIQGAESDFDFNTIIPMPKYIYKGNLGTEEREKYGSDNWYDWSYENWGTKWNAYSIEVESQEDTTLFLDFCTAWSPPVPILEHLWEKKTI